MRDISWSHNILIFEKCKDEKEREYYIRNSIQYGWSRNVLTHHIKTDLYSRDKLEAKQNNFQNTLPSHMSDMANEMIKSEYNLEFLGISKMNFYLNILNDTVKMEHENPAIGIILCSDHERLEVEYAIQNTNQPLGVATYTIEKELPKELEGLLPKANELSKQFKSSGETNS